MPTSGEEEKVRKAASMKHWWPKLQQCAVPTPETTMINIRDWETATEFREGVPIPDCDHIATVLENNHDTPAFIRTDQASNKHKMEESSKVPASDVQTVHYHVMELLSFNHTAGFSGLPWRDIVIRDWLPLKHSFCAFTGTPVAAEVRVFLHNNTVHDYEFYWPAEAIQQHTVHDPELPKNWRTQLRKLKQDTIIQFENNAESLAKTVAQEFDGYWSVDFALTEDEKWYAIDMAPGVASLHNTCDKPELTGLELGEFSL